MNRQKFLKISGLIISVIGIGGYTAIGKSIIPNIQDDFELIQFWYVNNPINKLCTIDLQNICYE